MHVVKISVRLYVRSGSSKGDCMGCAPKVAACAVVLVFGFLNLLRYNLPEKSLKVIT